MPFKAYDNQEAYKDKSRQAMEKSAYDKKSFIEKAGDFLGISNFGKGIGTTIFLMTPEGKNLQKRAEEGDKYAVEAFSKMMEEAPSNKQIVGSAAMTGLNILGGGALKGAKTLGTVGKMAMGTATGAAFGAAGAANEDKSLGEGLKQTAMGALTGGALTGAGILANKAKNAISRGGQAVAERTMNSAVKPTLQETEKVIEKGGKTLGRELLDRKIKGGSQKLFQVAKEQLKENDKQLMEVLAKHKDKVISKQDILREFKGMIKDKLNTPTLAAQKDLEVMNKAFTRIPESMGVMEANKVKRLLYKELGSKAFKMDPNLSLEGEINEKLAEALKKNIEKKTGDVAVKMLNKELGIFKQLKEAARGNIARTTRNQQAGVGTIGAMTEKIIGAVPIKTRAAVKIDQLSKAIGNIKADTAGRISKQALLNALNSLMR